MEKKDEGLNETSIEELLDQFSECKDCRKIIMKTCCRRCSECKSGLCNTCDITCSRCPRSMCKGCSKVAMCSVCSGQICGFCKLTCNHCGKVLCTFCKTECTQCKAKGCAQCVSLRSCIICGRLQCARCRTVCTRCQNEICRQYCQRICTNCKGVYCLKCIAQCGCLEWVLDSAEDMVNVGLSHNRLSVWAVDQTKEAAFVLRGMTEFKTGVHRYSVLIEKIQTDCAGSGFGLSTLSSYAEWKQDSQKSQHIAKYLLGMTANGSGLSPTVIGLHTGLAEGHSYAVQVDRVLQELRICGPGTDIRASLEPDEVYIPVFTRCHGSFRLTVQHGV